MFDKFLSFLWNKHSTYDSHCQFLLLLSVAKQHCPLLASVSVSEHTELLLLFVQLLDATFFLQLNIIP